MKTLKIAGLALLLLFTSVCYAQIDSNAINQIVSSKTFLFKPTQMTLDKKESNYTADNSLGSIDLSAYIFYLNVKPDSVDIYMPSLPDYIKDAQLPMLGHVKFASTKFNYSSRKAKNGVLNISIDCKDNPYSHPYRIRLAINKLGEVTSTIDMGYGRTMTLYGKLLNTTAKS
ncbi:DUF4251 domain-containing protein [Pedobacter sp. KR3-3]|uniref:DUF4251 domain-containing protein n=1 Tax=Pedobacter albus TaxID=3113905 RepID=A0ABU7I9D0_9SPHI|nr:DUF4251 domain-containing protein [Pedobacter sp. KR3-3]MEE1946080.1 DUF4251 domain-containing protein [Pedobacter sp. KR3-3]